MTKESKKEQIKAKKVGDTLIVVIDKKTYKTVASPKFETSLINKITLFNKTNKEATKNQLLAMLDKKAATKEAEKAKAKGIKKTIKKVAKKIASKKKVEVVEPKSLVEQVKTEFNEGNFSEQEIKELEDLLRRKKEAIAVEAPPAQAPARRGEY